MDPLWTALAALLLVVSVLVAVRGLFGGGLPAGPRCPKCGYDLSGTRRGQAQPPWVCPECGRVIRREDQLHRTRRRHGLIVLGMLGILGAYLAQVTPRLQKAGLVGVVPTNVLICWVSVFEPPAIYNSTTGSFPVSSMALELNRRLGDGELWDLDRRQLISQMDVLQTREAWPRGSKPTARLLVPAWLSRVAYSSFRASTGLPGEFRDHFLGMNWEIGDVAPDARSVTFYVSIGDFTGRFVRPFRWVGDVPDAIKLVDTPEITAQVMHALSMGVYSDSYNSRSWDTEIAAKLDRGRAGLAQDIAVALRVELRCDDQLSYVCSLSLPDSEYGQPVDWVRFLRPTPAWNESDPADMKRWTVRIIGDPSLALGDHLRTKAWSGQFEVPLSKVWRPTPQDRR